jgi:hypothetical protein
MNKLTFKEWSDLSDLQTIVNLKEDQEFSMARGELKTAQDAVKRLMGKLKGEGDLEAWVQSKITKAAEYLDTVADHLSHGEDDTVRKSDPESKLEMKEGFKGHKSVEEIAKKHKVSPSVIQNQLEMGMKVEHEHTTDNDAAMDIALQHLDEIPNYYSKLKKMEKVKEDIEILDAEGNLFATVIDIIDGSNYKFKSFTQPITEDAVSELERQLKKLNNTSYDSIDKLMRNIMKEHDMTAKELHNAFVKKHAKTPDEWIKESIILEKCWKGYKKKGMKTMFGKRYPNCVKEEGLRDWFGKSKSKDGKSGWVNVVTGGTCASDEPGEGTPKCVSSSKRASMTDEERKSASRRKKSSDPGQQSKSGAAKPTYVATDVKEESDKKTKGSGTKDACYTKVKSRYSVWPSAYASGALVKCRKVGAANWGNKSESVDTNALSYDWDYPIAGKMQRYCPKCKKNETRNECRYGPKYFDMFSIQSSLARDAYDPTEMHPANEQVSFEIGAGHNAAKKTAKIRNLATGTTNPNEKSAALRKLSGPSLPLTDSVIQPGQLTNEDYQRIQSTGNVYTILFSWRGRPMMNLQLFFPNMNRPSKEEVKTQIEKLYPGAVIMQWHPSPTDPSKPIIVIQK